MDYCIMKIAPKYTTLRINNLEITTIEALNRVEKLLEQQKSQYDVDFPNLRPFVHPKIADLIVIPAVGPLEISPSSTSTENATEIYVDSKCAKAVCRGADVFRCGILGSSRHFDAGEIVSVFGLTAETTVIRGWKIFFEGPKTFLGNGRTLVGRKDIFNEKNPRELKGVGVQITQPIFVHPKLNDDEFQNFGRSWFMAQNLPSVVCGHVLDPRPGQTVLDMCAAPGGKSCHLATLMRNKGRLICVDESSKRLENLINLARRQNFTCIETFCEDSAQLYKDEKNFPPDFFDRILLDAPCSGDGNRPILSGTSENLANTLPSKQRKLLICAVKLLKPGGNFVYSTCSLNKAENEENVEWFLQKFPEMELCSQDPFFVLENKNNNGIQKFDPRIFCPVHKNLDIATTGCLSDISDSNYQQSSNLNCDQDTIGFFIAKFVKKMNK